MGAFALCLSPRLPSIELRLHSRNGLCFLCGLLSSSLTLSPALLGGRCHLGTRFRRYGALRLFCCLFRRRLFQCLTEGARNSTAPTFQSTDGTVPVVAFINQLF